MHNNMHNAWKKHRNTVYSVVINLVLKKGLKFYQTRSSAIILHETLPAYCIPKVVGIKTGEVLYEKVHMSPRPPPKISLKHDWKKELGSEVAQRPEGQVVQRSKSSQSKKPNLQTQIMLERRNPLSAVTQVTSQVQEKRPVPRRSKHVLFVKKLLNMMERGNPLSAVTQITSQEPPKHVHLMTPKASTLKIKQHMIERGTPVVGRDASHEPGHEQSMLNEVNIDFRIPGLPHSVVKQA